MTFQPVIPAVLVVLVVLAFVGLAVWCLVRRPDARLAWSVRLALVVACGALLLRPGIPGTSETLATEVDILLVVDTTASIVAEDWDVDRPRLEGVREDVQRIVNQYPGARFGLITFDADAVVRVPLTTDTTALVTSLSVLRPEVTANSRGSSIGAAASLLQRTLQSAASVNPERARMVFYFGDGEQTRDTPPGSMADAAQYISDGAVFGYGTERGGPMRPNLEFGDDDAQAPYLVDTTVDGSPTAISRIDEDALRRIASELGVPYAHRAAGTDPPYPDVGDRIGEEIEVPEVAVAQRLYWVPVLPAFLLLLWDLVLAARNVGDLRAASPARKGRAR